jgi:hypothetical protein
MEADQPTMVTLGGGGMAESSDPAFPRAPQPDIVRAAQKDEYYKRLLYDKYFDLIHYFLGAFNFPTSATFVLLVYGD